MKQSLTIKNILIFLFMLLTNYLPAIDRVVLTPKGEYHQDPEILQKDPNNGKARIVYLDGKTREAWVADINPKTG